MTDPLDTTPSDPPMVTTPLLTSNGFTVCGKFSSDLADLCNAAGAAGMTPNMIAGQLWNMAMLIGFQVKDDVDAAINAPAPTPAPAPVTEPPQSGPVASGPSDPGMGTPPSPLVGVTLAGSKNEPISGTFNMGTQGNFAGGTAPLHGTALVYSDGSYSYSPLTDYVGSDNFTFVITAPDGSTTTVPVAVTIS